MRVAAETLLPQPVGHDDDVLVAQDAFFGQKVSALGKKYALEIEPAGAQGAGPHHFRAASDGEIESPTGEGHEILKDGALPLPIQVIAGGDSVVMSVDLGPDHDQLVGIGIWQGGEDGAVDDAEYGGAGADTQGKREDSDGGEPRIFAQHAQAEKQFAQQIFQPEDAAAFAAVFLGLLQAAEFEQRVAPGFFGGHAGAEIVGDMHFEMTG